MRLYEISESLARVESALEENCGEMTPEIQALLEQVEEQGPAKIEAAAAVIQGWKVQEEAIAAEIGRLQGRKESFARCQDTLRTRMIPALQALGGKVKGTKFTVYQQTRRGWAFTVKPGREMWEIDPRFFRTREPELNKAELKKAAEAGEELPEALDAVPTETTSLVIR